MSGVAPQLFGAELQATHCGVHVLEQQNAGIRKLQRLRTAVKQQHAEVRFERPDLVADCRGGETKFFACSLETQQPGDDLKCFQELK